MKQVTPTPRKTTATLEVEYLVLHRGLDALELNLRERVPEALGALLEVKRDQAKEIGHAVEFERNGVLFRISPNGAKGGFQYELVCPADDTRLLLRKPNAKPKVGVKVVFSAKTLALRGLPNALSKLKYATEALGLAYYEGNIDVCRFDVCTDILAPGFVLDSEHFVCHSRHGTRDFGLYSDTVERGYAAANLETVMIGRLPGREVTLYDKRLEIERRQSWGLEEIWNTCLREQRRPHCLTSAPMGPNSGI